jgi:cytosol alanyl aminopeptidase
MRSVLLLALLGSVAHASTPTLRLPGDVKPTRYAARLTVAPTEPTFAGSIDIDVTVVKATDVVWLDATALTISAATITSGGKTTAARTVGGGEDFVGLTVGKSLAPGSARLHLEYRGAISRTDDRGLFAQKEGGRWYAITQFEAAFARRVFPCFDEPNYKVPWQLTLEVPADDVALSNTHVVGEKREHAGMKTVTFAATPPLPVYLVAFAVGPYDVLDGGRAGRSRTPVRVAVPSGRAADAEYARATSGKLVELLEGYFGMPFPYEKLDAVAIPLPTEFGAMENAGIVTFAQSMLVAPPSARGIDFQREYAHVAAHEFAHQWFGDLVTTAWWDDIWLNESFANWLEAKIIGAWKPEWSHGTLGVDSRRRALGADTLVTSRRIRQPIESDDDIINIFDPITYEKGQTVLGMVERWLGADVFQRGIRKYIATHANGNADAEEFIAAISEAAGGAAGRDVGPTFRSFLNQAGAPLVDVSLSCGAKPSLTLKQQRFLPLGSKGSAAQTWTMPVCARFVVDGKEGRACQLVKNATTTMALPGCPTWLLANDDLVGYYRAAYSPALFASLMSDGGRKRLALHEELGTLDDVGALVAAGRMPAADALALVSSLADDPRRQIAEWAAHLVAHTHELDVPRELEPALARFVGKSFGARAHALGWIGKPGEDEDTRLLRPNLVALVAHLGGDAALRDEARKLTERWLDDKRALPPEVTDAVLREAGRGADAALFERLHAALKTEKDRVIRSHLVAALASLRNPDVGKRALAIVLSDEIDPRESFDIVVGFMGDNEMRPLGWDFLRANWDRLVPRLPAESVAFAPMLAVGFCDDAHRQQMDQFFRPRSVKLPGGPRILDQALESIAVCTAERAHEAPSVAAFLSRW